MIVYKKTDEWYIEWQQVTKIDNEWQRIITSGATNDNEWYDEWQRMTTNDNKWQQVVQEMKTNDTEQGQVKESHFGFRIKQYMQCITTIYSAI